MNKNLSHAIKAVLLCVCFSFFQNKTQAQTFDNGIFFQALARDNYSNPAKDRKIYVQSTIIQSTITGTKVLVEEFQTTTDASGVFGISIGKGNRTGGSFSNLNSIDWSAGPYFLNLQISITPIAPLESWNYAKDWIDLGTTSFGTVPYALHAKTVVGFDTKLNTSDTAKMLTNYAKTQLVNTKLNVKDSITSYVTPTQLESAKFDTTSLSNRIDLKANNIDVVANSNNIAANTASITSIANNIAANTASITANANNIAANTASIAANTSSIALKADIASLATVATSGNFNDLINKPTGNVSSVGNINGSSNANGAIITSGVLSLTPADGTNGGIITNGTQTIAGNKTLNGTTTFASNISIRGLTLGLGTGSQTTYFGNAASAYGNNSTAIGFMSQNANTGLNNTSLGSNTLRNTGTGSYNTAVGSESGQVVASYNTFIGASTNGAAGVSNATALGYGAYLTESNSIQLGANGTNGTTAVTKVKTSGKITSGAVTYPNTDGSNGEVLTTNGSGTANWSTVLGTTNSIWISNSSFEIPSTPSAGVESFYGVFNGYYYKFLSLYNTFSGGSQTRSYFTPPSTWGNGSYTVTVYFLTSTSNTGTIQLEVGVIPTTMSGNVTSGNEFGGNNAGGFQYGSTNYTHVLTAAASNGTWTPRPLQKASFTQNFNFANIDYAVVQLGRYMNQGLSYSDTYPDKVYIVGVKITKN